jgi:MYXO-CTERM domain-containing protein
LSRIAARPHPPVAVGGVVLTALGLTTVAVGTFLPWVRSGSVLRDSYQSIAVLRTIKVVDGSPLSLVLDAWTLLIPVITVCIVVYALGFRRSAATVSGVVAIISGTVAGAATVVSGGEEIRLGIASAGPVTTTVGAVLALVGVAGIFAGRRRRATENAGGEP